MMKTASVPHLLSLANATFPFVISTEVKRSGEISVLTPLLGNVFRQCEVRHLLPPGVATFLSVISTEAKAYFHYTLEMTA
jgi:hypothetical protein